MVDRKEARALAKAVGARNKASWVNAIGGISLYPNKFRYVEGFVITEGMALVVEHAWLERVKDGVIVDPTPIYHCRELDRRYFAGVKYRWSRLAKLLDSPQPRPPYAWADKHGMKVVPAYQAARQAAERVLYGTDLKSWAERVDAIADGHDTGRSGRLTEIVEEEAEEEGDIEVAFVVEVAAHPEPAGGCP